MALKVQNLLKSIRADRKKAWDAVTEIEYGSMTTQQNEWHLDSEYDVLEWANQCIYIKLLLALEIIGAPGLADELKLAFKSLKKINAVDMPYYSEGMICPATVMLDQYIEAIGALHESQILEDKELELVKLERFLMGTPKMIYDSQLNPSNEAEVRKEVYKHIIHPYPDTVRELPIPKVAKTYKPDFGVKSLKSAIEYKFIDSECELKSAIGGVFEDVAGYAGSEDWTTFFAIFYATKPFMSQEQLLAEFRIAKIPDNWKPILVTGDGKRQKRAALDKIESPLN